MPYLAAGVGSNFTDRARAVLAFAREEAARCHHDYVGTEHLLLGLLREGEGVGIAVLTNLNVDLEGLAETVHNWMKPGVPSVLSADTLPFTSRTKKVLELAMNEAALAKHKYVGTEHLLLALLKEEKGVAGMSLRDLGVTYDTALPETLRLLGGHEMNKPVGDPVYHPPHYNRGNLETIDAIESMVTGWPATTGYRLGNTLKYIWRHRDKGDPVENLEKAKWYLDRELAALKRDYSS